MDASARLVGVSSTRGEKTMQTRMIAGVARLVLTVSVFVGMTTAQAQSTDRTDEYKAEIASIEHFNEVQREADMPEMPVPSYEEWLKVKQEAEAEVPSRGTASIEDAATRWERRLDEVRPYLCTLVRSGEKKSDDHRSQVARQEKEQLLRVADERWARRDEVERRLDEIAARLGVERKMEVGEGRSAVLAGEMNGEAVWLVPQNQIAAASISADELWPTNTAPWPSSSTGLDLTGTNVLLGMWEVGGAVRETHYEFQGRVIQADSASTLNYHATGVAGTMAAGGVLYFTSPATGRLMRGVAYQSDVDAYDIDDFQAETADAAAGTTNQAGLRLSNHSWGLANGWIRQNVPVPNAWVWRGFYECAEDAKFGYYTPALPDGTGCVDLDAFLATNATRHLLIYAAGNDRLIGPGTPTTYYWYYNGQWYIFENPGSGDRDWINGDGDTYCFDTMAAPGTAKNVLTVGSVRDVFHTVASQTNWGYASNSTLTLSTFSACGPTDDGRIKPDIVAVGEANPSARAFPVVTPDADSDTDAQGIAGTSIAAPGVTAGLALPFQRRNQLFTNLTSEADAFRGSTWKGLAIHTADDVGTVGPDYQTGWGLFNAVSAVRQVELDAAHGRGTHIKEIELAVGETNSWLIQLDGSKYKGTVLWPDPAGAPSETVTVDPTTPMLVNNIDFWLETEDGSQTFLPWVLNPDLTNKTEAARAAAATTGYDARNNIEQVVIGAPTAGTYRVFLVHAGGTAGGQTPTSQWVTMLSDGDIPLDPDIKEFEQSSSTNQFLLTFQCDPAASLILESSTNLLNASSWVQEGSLTTESWTNAVLASPTGELRFWRLRRETGN